MFNYSSAGPFTEARILTVDSKRKVCQCRTKDGKLLTNVRYAQALGGSTGNHPEPEETVAITWVSGEPVVCFSLGLIHSSEVQRNATINRLRNTSTFYKDFNLSFIPGIMRRKSRDPEDAVPGDQITSNDTGSLFGLLKAGTFLAKASALAQIIVSRMDDLVRIVSRNYEMFSDAMIFYSVNLRGKPYTYQAYFRTSEASRKESPDYYEVMGDVDVGDMARNYPLTTYVSSAPTTTVVKKQVITSKDGLGDVIGARWVSTYSLDGKRLETSSGAVIGDYTEITTDNQVWTVKVVTGASTTYLEVAPDSFKARVHSSTSPNPLEVTVDGATNLVTVKSNKTTLDCPTVLMTGDAEISGNLKVTGNVEGLGKAKFTDEVSTLKPGYELKLSTHWHGISGGTTTTPSGSL